MKLTIRTFIAKIPLAKPLYYAVKQRREELHRQRLQDQIRKKQPIIRQGSLECFEGLPIQVVWDLTSNCNIRCSYCFNARKGYKKDFCTLEQAETTIKHLASANRPSYRVELMGGEPTTHPHLVGIISLLHKHLGNRLEVLQITSNGSFSESQMEAILKAGEQVNVKLAISVHLEYISIERVVELVKRFSNRIYLNIRVMFQPDLFEKAVAMTDILCSLRRDYSFDMEMGLLREGWPTFDKYDHRYTQEHFEWAEKTKKRFDEVAIVGTQWTKACPKTTKEELLVVRNVRGVVEKYEQISQSEFQELTGSVFTGMTCCAGTNIIRIEADGRVKGMVCVLDHLDRLNCNIFEENPFLREDWIHGVQCTKSRCGCSVNYCIPKFKSPVAAKKFIEKKRLEQKKLMSE